MGELIDITGMKFGKFTIIKQVPTPAKYKNKGANWLCKCVCGNKKIMRGSEIKFGNTKSCGCSTSELMRQSRRLEDGLSQKRTVFTYYVRNAKQKNISFKLTFNQLIDLTSSNCFYCGTKPSNIQKSKNNCGDYIYNGLDRLDNKKGYTLDNVVPCCKICNIAKNTRELKEFKDWIIRVANHLGIK